MLETFPYDLLVHLIARTDAVIEAAQETFNIHYYYNSFSKVYALLLKESSISKPLKVRHKTASEARVIMHGRYNFFLFFLFFSFLF